MNEHAGTERRSTYAAVAAVAAAASTAGSGTAYYRAFWKNSGRASVGVLNRIITNNVNK